MKMRLNVDDQILAQVMELTGASSAAEALATALNEYLRMKRKEQLLSLSGKLRINTNWRKLRDLEKREN